MNVKIVLFWVFLPFSAFAQIKGIVKDSLTGKPIPYVSIWTENGTTGTTSEENGTFHFIGAEQNKVLVFSSLGYLKKKIPSTAQMEVLLSAKATELKEMVISKWKGTKTREVGETENAIAQAFENAPNIDLKYFPYVPAYKKTKFLKKVSIYTDCRIESASMKLHFYSVDANGLPGEELIQQEFFVSVKKGIGKSSFSVEELGLRMPSNGIFIGFEKLMIEKNKTDRKYYPLVLYNYQKQDFQFVFSGGKWGKKSLKEEGDESTGGFYEPAINLILTN